MTNSLTISRRSVNPDWALSLQQADSSLSPLEASLLASRGASATVPSLPSLLATPMLDLERGALRLVSAIQRKEPVVVVADYDCDGATSCAVAVLGLRALGANVHYVVPDRMVHGYGISPSVVDLAKDRCPGARVLMTVDNGVMGHAGIAYAAGQGIDVVVTDHHLPGESLPSEAVAVIDPARTDDSSGLTKLAGVGVALWLVVATKKALAKLGVDTPPLNFLLPYVAVGTVADMVGFDAPNRLLVTLGMARIRSAESPVGLAALIKEAALPSAYLTTQDIGFSLAPRINAAGRLESMEAGIDLLLSQDKKQAGKLAKLLTDTNNERKRLQKDATAEAAATTAVELPAGARAIVQGSSEWHPGIVGLVASRLKDAHNLPVFVFSLCDGVAKGSGRSIVGFHLKDALEEVARRAPGLLAKFGGHAMAAGATLTSVDALSAFDELFSAVARERISPEMLSAVLLSDGPMPDLELLSAAKLLRHPWGQGFEAPAFDDEALVTGVRPLGKSGEHWRIEARVGGRPGPTAVVLFNHPEPVVGQLVRLYLTPGLNTWLGKTTLQWQGRIIQ